MSDETVLSKVLEAVESLQLPEGDYLKACNLIKECHKHKDRWVSETKIISKKFGVEMKNSKDLFINIYLTKILLWKKQNSDSPFVSKPDNLYTFEVQFLNDKKEKTISKNIEKPLDEIDNFIENLANLHSIDEYSLFIEDVKTSEEEMYDWIETFRTHVERVMELNSDSDEDEFHVSSHNFYSSISTDLKKIFQIASFF
jgi:hypothetical protein